MTLEDRKRRALFIVAFRRRFLWPSQTMAIKCWRSARESMDDDQLDLLIDAMDKKLRSEA